MSVDAEFSNGPSILTGEKLPEVGNSDVACENASSCSTVMFAKETSNCPADKGQVGHNTASQITGIGEMSGEPGGLDKVNDDEKLNNGSAEAANAGNSGDKLQCHQSEKTENADTDGGQGALSMVSEIKGVNERGGDSNGDVNLVCEKNADTEKVESNGQKAPSTEIKAVEEIMGESNGSRKNDKSVDAEKGDINNSMAIDPVTETMVGMEGMRDESSGPRRSNDDRRLSEESADTEKVESDGQREPITVTAIKAVEEMSGESNGSSENDKSVDDEKEDINSSMAINPVTETASMEETRGESSDPHRSNDDRKLSEESGNSEKVESDGQREPSTVTKIKTVEEIRGESNGSSKNDETVDDVKEDINSSMTINPVTETVGMEEMGGESCGSHRSNDDKKLSEVSAGAEKEDSSCQGAVHLATEMPRMEQMGCLSSFVQNSSEDKLLSNQRENAGNEDSNSQSAPNMIIKIKGINEIGGDSNCDIKLVCEGSADTEKVEINGQTAPSTVTENKEIRSESNSSSKIDESKDAEKAGSNNSMAINIVTEISGSEGQSNGVEKINITSEITGIDVESDGAEEISNDKLVHQESTNIEKADSQGQKVSKLVSEIKGIEDLEGESDVTNKRTDGNSTYEDKKDDEIVNGSTPVHKGIDDVASGKESVNSSDDGVQNVCDTVLDTICNEEIGSKSDDDKDIDDKAVRRRDEDSEGVHFDGLASEGISCNAEFSEGLSTSVDSKFSEVGNYCASSTKDVSSNDAVGAENEALNSSADDSQQLGPNLIRKGSGAENLEGELNGGDNNNGILHKKCEDREKSHNGSDNVGVSCNDEICHNQDTLVDLELSEAGNTSSSRNVSSYDAATFENESLTCPIEIDQKSANMSIEITGTEENTGGSDRSDDDKLKCEQSEDAEISNTNEVLATLAECSSVDVAAARDMNIAAKGFYFLIRMPRFDEEKIRECIQVAELNVDEKTQHRDAVRQKIRNKRANCQTHGAEFEAAKAQERDARKQVRTKRADISSLQDIIDKAKNAVAVGEIDNRICNMEHIIGHETVPLKEEKLLIREIKQLKQLRGQLSSNIGSQDEVQKSLDEREVNEERLRALKKELDNLKVKASKAETIAMAASRKFEDESRQLKELQAQFRAADDIRQEAYEELRILKKGLYEKNIHFRTYKDEATLASDHARKREMEALNHLCVNQVERYMELWNKNDEFRKDYIRCNTRSTVRRFGTLDGRTLGPDEEPIVLPIYHRVERVNRLVASLDKVHSVSQPPISRQEKQVVVLKDEIKDDNIILQAAEGMNQVEKTKEARKPIQIERTTVAEPKEPENLQTAQELEAARKEEELRKLEEEARLKEQRRLEEIAKAKEALERKKRNAEKAQLRAELRAQKEEEQRLKEREKRLRKKERKKGFIGETQSESNDGETALISTSPRETVKELEATENSQTTTKKPQKSSQYTKQTKTKSIPPPLRNRNRKKLQQWLWLTLSCIVVIALFFLGNIGFFSNLKPRRNPGF